MNKSNVYKVVAGITAILGVYYIVKYFNSRKIPSANQDNENKKPSDGISIEQLIPSAKDNFPLKKGSKGERVGQLQSLLLKIDKNLLPKFGADKDFGSETESAVVKVLGKNTIDSQLDLDRLNVIFNRKTFPYVTKNPDAKPIFPVFKTF